MWRAVLSASLILGLASNGAGAKNGGDAEIRRARDRTVMPDEVGLTYHLDGDKLNRINAFRIAEKIEEFPDLFGENKEFRLLVTIRAYGPGSVLINGNPATGNLEIPVGEGGERIEVYPHYKIEELAADMELQEGLSVSWKDKRGERTVDSRTIPWSSPREFFLTPKRFGDLAAMAWNRGKAWNGREDCPRKLESLAKYSVKYEKPSVTEGWQRVRSIDEILKEKKANCLDLTVWITGNCAQSGWMSKIYILGNHSMPTFGSPLNPLILESTALVESEIAGKARKMEEALKEGEKNYKESIEQGGQEIDLKYWRPFYRYPNQKN